MKRVTFQEVIAQIRSGEKYKSELFTITLDAMNELTIEHKDGFDDNDSGIYFNMSEKIFSKVEKPVTFMEAVNSGKRCRVEYPNAPDGYWFLDDMLCRLGDENSTELCAEIIKNGKWYVEE